MAEEVRTGADDLDPQVADKGLDLAEDGRELKGELLGLLTGELPTTIKLS